MDNLWSDSEAKACGADPLSLRVYSSRLIGREPSLVLHGGGNTSLKAQVRDVFGQSHEVLYVKGSGWDLATIERPGFAPVKMDVLLKMAKLESLSDGDMVREQKAAMTDPGAPAPSVEAILHAIIPFAYVDHTHADAVVAVSNTPEGLARIREIYRDRMLVLPYVMPGFILARQVHELTRKVDWNQYDGMILMHHGIFSFGHSARESYDRMIRLVSMAEDLLKAKGVFDQRKAPEKSGGKSGGKTAENLPSLAALRRAVSSQWGQPVVARLNQSPQAVAFSALPNLRSISTRGPLTPDHVIHTKRIPLIVGDEPAGDVAKYAEAYNDYFKRHTGGALQRLDSAPRWAILPGQGTVAFGQTIKRADVVADISRHTMKAIQWAEGIGGWTALPERDIFDVEYWELEQAKLKKAAGASGGLSEFQGKVALVTGGASGIGKACVEALREQGAAVVALDIQPGITDLFHDVLGVVCDVTDPASIESAVEACVRHYGGIDIVVTNAGSFPAGKPISELDPETWRKSIDLNLTSHQYLMKACVPYLEMGWDPSLIVIGSKNVPAPGPGAAAYSVAKAGLTQLARVAALELGPKGIRVNIIHPNAVFDTGIWSDAVLQNRAKSYGLSVDDYKKNNILKTEVSSKDVARMVCAMAGPAFAKTTGAQVAVDGGNDRVI